MQMKRQHRPAILTLRFMGLPRFSDTAVYHRGDYIPCGKEGASGDQNSPRREEII